MLSVTWVEMSLLSVFAATFLLSVGFCVTNYAEGSKALILLRRATRSGRSG